MSLFDAIKYGTIDINSKDDLNQLPSEVVKKWHARVVEHACQSAESVVHKDKYEKSQKLIDFTRKFMRGEVDNKVLSTAMDAAYYEDYSSYNAARSVVLDAAYAASEPVSDAAYFAARAAFDAASATADFDESIATAAMKLYKEWIIEELVAYESEEFCN